SARRPSGARGASSVRNLPLRRRPWGLDAGGRCKCVSSDTHAFRPLCLNADKEVHMFSRFGIAVLVSLILVSPSRADQAETIVVTASRVPIAADQSGSAVTVLLGDTLRAEQIDQIFDALRMVPGIEVSRTGTVGSFAQVRIRGAEAGHEL